MAVFIARRMRRMTKPAMTPKRLLIERMVVLKLPKQLTIASQRGALSRSFVATFLSSVLIGRSPHVEEFIVAGSSNPYSFLAGCTTQGRADIFFRIREGRNRDFEGVSVL